MKDYELLPTELKKKGMLLRQVKRNDDVAIYEVSYDHTPEKVIGHEVFKITIREAQELYGKAYPRMEAYPSDTMFGNTAYSVTSREYAEEYWDRLNKEIEAKERLGIAGKKGRMSKEEQEEYDKILAE